jgi:competence protein ComEA
MKVELNTADSAELVKLYGIGPYYAQKILEYRERLGGFAIPEQLLEIKGFDKDRLDGFYDRVFADTSFIRKINLKTASENQLANHLYIGRYLARCIIRYRDTADPDSCSVEHLVRHGILTQEQGQKIGWYLR